MSATAQRNFSLSKGDADEKTEPDHLLVLVHGILARYHMPLQTLFFGCCCVLHLEETFLVL